MDWTPPWCIAEAQSILAKAFTQPVAQEERTRILQLAEALFQSIRMQLSVERYQAEAVERGGNLDTVDAPVTNGPVARASACARLALCPRHPSRSRRSRKYLNRTNPGPGGFYDDLGDICAAIAPVRGLGSVEDPELRKSVLIGHRFPLPAEMPLAWKRWAEALFDAPLRLHYPALDPQSTIQGARGLRGRLAAREDSMACEGGPEIHPSHRQAAAAGPLEFDIPPEATAGGELTLAWTREPGLGGNGRGAQVAEVWLLRR